MLDVDVKLSRASLREVLATIFRYRKPMLVVFLAVSIGAALVALLQSNLYRSDATILIRPGRENMAVDPSIIGPALGGAPGFPDVVRSEVSIITSRFIAETVAKKIGPQAILGDETLAENSEDASVDDLQSKAEEAIAKNLHATVVASTVELNYTARSRELAQSVLQEIVDAYMRRHVEVHAYGASPKVFEANLALLKETLTKREDELEKFRGENKLPSLSAQKQNLITAVNALETRIATLTAEHEAGIARLAALNRAKADRPEMVETGRNTGLPNPTAESLKQKLVDIRMKEMGLESMYVESYKPLVALREQRAAIEKTLAAEPGTGTSTSIGHDSGYQAIALQIDQETALAEGRTAEREALSQELESTRKNLDALSGKEITLARLERSVKTAEADYLRYSENVSRASSYAAFDEAQLTNVAVLQSATLPIKPVTRKKRTIALGLFLGTICAVGCACVLDYFDDSLRTRMDVRRRLNVPVLAVIHDAEFKVCV